jgi:hypothetical protein
MMIQDIMKCDVLLAQQAGGLLAFALQCLQASACTYVEEHLSYRPFGFFQNLFPLI